LPRPFSGLVQNRVTGKGVSERARAAKKGGVA
jgi:hypothetical protein